MQIIIHRCYDKYYSTNKIVGEYGFITFTKNFEYFGSIVSYYLDDYTDIMFRIKKVNQVMGVLIVLGFKTRRY